MYSNTNQLDWDEFVPFALFAYRVSVQESTNETPFFLLYGREPNLPTSIEELPNFLKNWK